MTLLLGVLIALSALGMDMFLPAVPVLAGALGAEPGAAQHSVTGYLLGLAVGQLAWGPISDRFGRKPVLLAGLGLFLASSVCGALPFGLGALVSAALAAAFDGTVRPMAYAIALFGACSFVAERTLFRKVVHG